MAEHSVSWFELMEVWTLEQITLAGYAMLDRKLVFWRGISDAIGGLFSAGESDGSVSTPFGLDRTRGMTEVSPEALIAQINAGGPR